ncbi:MAG: four helix bundle protein [Prevotella sp.]|jgi:four helix bundle protein|nr:four helix bundle protein [Prevotella sp.]
MATQSFEQLIVWQKAHQYVLSIYRITKQYPKEEIFGLVNQMRRAATSITANIAEGYIRIGSKEKLRFYNISQGSLEETRNFIILSKDLDYISEENKKLLSDQASEVSKLLNAYCKSIINELNNIPSI